MCHRFKNKNLIIIIIKDCVDHSVLINEGL